MEDQQCENLYPKLFLLLLLQRPRSYHHCHHHQHHHHHICLHRNTSTTTITTTVTAAVVATATATTSTIIITPTPPPPPPPPTTTTTTAAAAAATITIFIYFHLYWHCTSIVFLSQTHRLHYLCDVYSYIFRDMIMTRPTSLHKVILQTGVLSLLFLCHLSCICGTKHNRFKHVVQKELSEIFTPRYLI